MPLFLTRMFLTAIFLLMLSTFAVAGSSDIQWLQRGSDASQLIFGAGGPGSLPFFPVSRNASGVPCTTFDAPVDYSPHGFNAYGGSWRMIGNAFPLNCNFTEARLIDSTWLHIDRIVRPQSFSSTIYAYFTADPNFTGQSRSVGWTYSGLFPGGGLEQAGGCVVTFTPSSSVFSFPNSGGETEISIQKTGTCPADTPSVDDPSVHVSIISPNILKIVVDPAAAEAEEKIVTLRYGSIRAAVGRSLRPLRKPKFIIRTRPAVMGVRG